MRKLILFLLVFVSAKVSAQVYQEMPQYGYRANRMAFDSTLQIPTVCGVPTLKSVVKTNKSGAIAYDSCNARFYAYNPKTLTWSVISGGGGGTTPTLQQVTDAGATTTNGISVAGLRLVNGGDSIALNRYGDGSFVITRSNSSDEILNVNDGVNGYLKFGGGGGSYVQINTSTNGNVDLEVPSTSGVIPISVNGYTADFTGAITIPTGVAVDTIFRTLGKDSIFYKKNNITYAIKDSVGNNSGSDTAKVVIAQVHNATATTLTKGEVVYLFGSTGNVASVKRANNKTDATSSKTFGIVRRDIAAGSTGFITTQGQLEKLNLGSYTEGDVLWLDSIDGQFTKVKPQAPYHGVFLGVVERANNGNGLAYIKVQNGVELDEVHDVQINSILNNQIIVYSDTQQVWKNRNITSLIDTTLFQRKSLSANTMMANNTSGTANATAQIFKQFGNQTYSDSITFTGATTPSGATNHTFRWSQIGNLVTIHLTLTYATAGSLSQVSIEIPDGLPTPILPTGLTANNDIIAYGTGFMTGNTTVLSTLFSKVYLRQNTGLVNDYDFIMNQGVNGTYRIFNLTIQYFAQ